MSRFGTSSVSIWHLLKHRDIKRPLGGAVSRVPPVREYATQPEISIPKRINREPTDILKALSSTIKKDMTAAEFKYMDDPYLIPQNMLTKKSYALAQEAGRKAARWIREEHSGLFEHKVADPFITAFAPLEKLTEKNNPTEELLISMIKTIRVSDAVKVYQLLENSGTDVSPATKQALLELVAYFNEEDDMHEDWVEERAFVKFGNNRDQGSRRRKSWKDNGLAQKLFQSIKPTTPEAYCALINGMASYGHTEGAWGYYQQMKESGFVPDVTTYNHVISTVSQIKEGADKKWSVLEEILKEMVQKKIKPNIHTLNTVMEIISNFTIIRAARDYAMKILVEFQGIGIGPSLATYYHLLNVHYRSNNRSSPDHAAMDRIIRAVETAVPPLQDVDDVKFFARAMEVCNFQLDSPDLAKRLYKIYVQPSNQIFAGDLFMSTNFYRNFLLLLNRMEPPEQFMEYYSIIVPTVCPLEQGSLEKIMKTMTEYSAVNYVPQLWNDAVYMELVSRESAMESITAALASGSGPSASSLQENGEVDPILTTARSMWKYVETSVASFDPERRNPGLQWTGVVLGNLMKVFLQYGDLSAAIEAMAKTYALRSKLSNFVPVSALDLLVETCIAEKVVEPALMAVEYASDIGYNEASSWAKKMVDGMQLEDSTKVKLAPLLATVEASEDVDGEAGNASK